MKILKFYLPSCTPCKFVDQFLQDKDIEYQSINIEENDDLREKYDIMSVPVTVLLDSNGEETERVHGFNPAQLESLIAQLNS